MGGPARPTRATGDRAEIRPHRGVSSAADTIETTSRRPGGGPMPRSCCGRGTTSPSRPTTGSGWSSSDSSVHLAPGAFGVAGAADHPETDRVVRRWHIAARTGMTGRDEQAHPGAALPACKRRARCAARPHLNTPRGESQFGQMTTSCPSRAATNRNCSRQCWQMFRLRNGHGLRPIGTLTMPPGHAESRR